MKNKVKDRIKRAEAIALESLDYILETVPAPDYVQITGITGGDARTYRVYDDGSVFEK